MTKAWGVTMACWLRRRTTSSRRPRGRGRRERGRGRGKEGRDEPILLLLLGGHVVLSKVVVVLLCTACLESVRGVGVEWDWDTFE